jgi:hypothetical protein
MPGTSLLGFFNIKLKSTSHSALDALSRHNRRISARTLGTKYALVRLVMQLHEEGSIDVASYVEALLGDAERADPLIADTLRDLGKGIEAALGRFPPTFTVVDGRPRWKCGGGRPIQLSRYAYRRADERRQHGRG